MFVKDVYPQTVFILSNMTGLIATAKRRDGHCESFKIGEGHVSLWFFANLFGISLV